MAGSEAMIVGAGAADGDGGDVDEDIRHGFERICKSRFDGRRRQTEALFAVQ